MIKKEFPELGEFYWEETLKNGLVVRVIPKPEFSRAYAFLAVDFGSVDTSFTWNGQHYETPAGVAHYLEHKMFDLPEGSAMDAFARYGGSNNAFTNYTMQIIFLLAPLFRRENDPPTSLAAALLFLLVTNPWSILNVGLQLSFASISGIFLFASKIYEPIYKSRVVKKMRAVRPLGWLVKTVLAAFSCSMHSVEWLEGYIAKFRGTVLTISHDR